MTNQQHHINKIEPAPTNELTPGIDWVPLVLGVDWVSLSSSPLPEPSGAS
jgi:hypothetical protein